MTTGVRISTNYIPHVVLLLALLPGCRKSTEVSERAQAGSDESGAPGTATRTTNSEEICGKRDQNACHTWLASLCDTGDASGCHNLAFLLTEGGNSESPDRIEKLYLRGCEGGVPDSCYSLGHLVQERDTARGLALYERACEGDIGVGCEAAAEILSSSKQDTVKQSRARVVFRKACKLGQHNSCRNLGMMLLLGNGGDTDRVGAREAWHKGCPGDDDGASCHNLALLYAGGLDVEQDLAKARSLYELACDRDHPGSCFNLGLLLEEGAGGKADPSRAQQLFKKACTLGVAQACD